VVDFREKQKSGFAETRRDSKTFTGGARGERDRDRGETRWVVVFELLRLFY
jgi:hypothetical protein